MQRYRAKYHRWQCTSYQFFFGIQILNFFGNLFFLWLFCLFFYEFICFSYIILLVCEMIFSRPRHSRTAPPTDDLRADIEVTKTHLFNLISYLSIEFSEAEPSLPPKEYKKLSISTTSWVDLLECIVAMGSQTFRLGLNFSPVCRHMVPSFPPIQNRKPSRAATPAEDLRFDIDGTGIHLPIRGSNLSTLDW